jgi:hypothetical protein
MSRIYAIRQRTPEYGYGTLCEFTPAELRDEIAKSGGPDGWPRYERISGQRAHKWVKEGGHHETALYIDHNGRVRYATDGF